jgi:hypothetical protein
VHLRHKPYAGIDSATEPILSNRHAELIRDDTAELFFADQFWESMYLAAEGTDPFTPEKHALDIVDPVRLHMSRQELVKDPQFVDLLLVNVHSGQLELFTKPVQHLQVCLVHEDREKTVPGTHGYDLSFVDLLCMGGPEYYTGSLALRSGHQGITSRAYEEGVYRWLPEF